MNLARCVFPILALLLASCATGRLTRLHQDCGMTPFSWSSLAVPPVNEAELLSVGEAGPPGRYQSDHWFSGPRERFLLCRLDARFDGGCGATTWLFKQEDGRWINDPEESLITVCAD